MPIRIFKGTKFEKALLKLPKKEQKKITDEIDLFEDGKPVDITRLDKDLWRLKVDVRRVFIRFKGDLAEILTVERRKTTTYRKR